jgi:hypothetical protein
MLKKSTGSSPKHAQRNVLRQIAGLRRNVLRQIAGLRRHARRVARRQKKKFSSCAWREILCSMLSESSTMQSQFLVDVIDGTSPPLADNNIMTQLIYSFFDTHFDTLLTGSGLAACQGTTQSSAASVQ